jgi:hypothetical protein
MSIVLFADPLDVPLYKARPDVGGDIIEGAVFIVDDWALSWPHVAVVLSGQPLQ